MRQFFDHIDIRVPNLAAATPYYESLLPALGFTQPVQIEGWLQFEAGEFEPFVGVTESRTHVANENRVAFRANSCDEVDQLSEVVRRAGSRNIEGPMDYETNYYALFFEDPWGNRFEICHRARP
ncbi:MAG TPA: VOC family protein [Verrucomicrobiae bacterium]|nr:VOC family protein [Verrucomicrobiae bacterium]